MQCFCYFVFVFVAGQDRQPVGAGGGRSAGGHQRGLPAGPSAGHAAPESHEEIQDPGRDEPGRRGLFYP